MNFSMIPEKVYGLKDEELAMLRDLISIYEYHRSRNYKKARYYEGLIPLSEVNLGLALPENIRGFEIGCNWGAKTVDVLAARSMFDGFVSSNGETNAELDRIVRDNNLISEYKKECKDELKYGCTFITLSKDEKIKCRIRAHSAQTGAARWHGGKGRIDCGMAILDTVPDESKNGGWKPKRIALYTDTATIVIEEKDYRWIATRIQHKLGRPLMEPLIWNATTAKPLGQSRIKDPIRRLIQSYVRTVANATIGLEFATAPQKYILGVTQQQYDALVNNKFKQYVGSILTATTNPQTGEKPTFGQLTQGNIGPHVEMLRILSTQFSAATGLTVTDTGVINDANPTSSDAILAQSQTLVSLAEELNTGNGDSLRTIAQMALAIASDKTMEDLTEDQKDIVAHFKNPAMPSVAATSDAAIKIASARENFAQTDVFLEMIGFDQADIRRIKAQEQRARGQQLLTEIDEEDTFEDEVV